MIPDATETARIGLTVPFPGSTAERRAAYTEAADLGFTDVWSSEANGPDGLTPLVLGAAWEPRLRLGTAILPAFTRAPALLAQSAAALAEAAPGRFVLGVGSSSDVIVQRWNGVPFVDPYKRVRDVVRFLREALSGEKVTRRYDTFAVDGFRLGIELEEPPPVMVAALREGMLRLAGREGDGVIINWLGPDDVRTVTLVVQAAAGGAEREVVARIFVCPSDRADVVRERARYEVAAYMNVPVYADFQRWLGRGDQLEEMWVAWAAGDRRAAVAAIPDEVVDALVVHGSPDRCRARIAEYQANGVTTAVLSILPLDPDLAYWDAVRSLGPAGVTPGAVGR